MELRLKLADILVSQNACSSTDEAEVIAEIVLELDDDNDNDGDTENTADNFSLMQATIIENLIDNLDIEEDQAKAIFLELKSSAGYVCSDDGESDDSEGDDDTVESSSLNDDNYNDEESEDEYLVEGECELCDRDIKLTRHHLIPKSTWPRMQTKLLQAAAAEESGDREKALLILGYGLEYLLEDENSNRSSNASACRFLLSSDKAVIRAILHNTCDICRQCHTTLHRTHTNMELALNYNSVESLLEDERISKFCKWASKQKPGKFKRN
jgi:hypothetical protein